MASKKESFEFSRKSFEVKDGKILIFGDMHFSSSYEGQHINYTLDCYRNMERILELVTKEKPKAVFFLGDLVGVNERNLKDHQFLMRVMMFFAKLNSACKGNVYSVKGNHEMGDFSTFDLLTGLNYVKNPTFVDYYGKDSKEVRFHFVNYGDERLALEIEESEDYSNIVLGHAEYFIDGVTNWYSAKQGIEVKTLKNFQGVELIFSGHIHTPSDEVLYSNLPNGDPIGLFYPGSPSRTSERFNDCWYVAFDYSKDNMSTIYNAELFGLPSAEDIFYPKENFEIDENELTIEERQNRALDDIVDEVLNCRIDTGDLFAQIDLLPSSLDVKDMAKKYLRQAMEI